MVDRREGLGTLGTFTGVFTPSILTILGIILFLRLGFVVGNAGLAQTLLIIAIATAVSVLTSISLAAIATDIDVGGGGDYYLISRTLGVEFGGAIGVVLFLAQSVSVAFYAIGFGEVAADALGIESGVAVQGIALVSVLLIFILAWAGTDVATRFQFVVMAFLVAALLSFLAGAFGSADGSVLGDAMWPPPETLGFWALFAIFFPAVTGFTQGVSMSGDLVDPARSLPRGTFAAVGISTVVYVTAAVLLSASVPLDVLAVDTGQAMRSLAIFGPLVFLGVIAATLSSAMASFLGAPRILQSLAGDHVFPVLDPFAKGHGPQSNPRNATLVSLGIAVATVGLGSLNVIAPVVSMFFLISYGLLNYATYWEARAASPSFRPRFRFYDKRLSLAGALLSLGAMLAINVIAGAIALLLLFGVYQYLSRRSAPKRWADGARSHHFQRAKESIRALSNEEVHARHWRPHILVFSADPKRRERLLRFASWLEGGSGITAAIRILQGEGAVMRRTRDREEEALKSEIDELGLDVYPRVILAADGLEALPVVAQSFGIGGLAANVAVFGWPENPDKSRRVLFVRSLRDVSRHGVNIVAMSSDEQRWAAMSTRKASNKRIDVWWNGDDSSRLALLAAYLFTRTASWDKARIRILASVGDENAEDVLARVEAMLDEARIPADVLCLMNPDHDAIVATCADAALVFMTMRISKDHALDPMGGDLDSLLRRLPLTAAVLAGESVDLLAGPESGRHQARTEAEEAVEEATARLGALTDRADQIDEQIKAAAAQLFNDLSSDYVPLAGLEKQREALRRRVLKARARVESAQSELDSIIEDHS